MRRVSLQFVLFSGLLGVMPFSFAVAVDDEHALQGRLGAAAVQYTLTLSSTQGGHVSTPGEGSFTYAEGEEVLLTATADPGYHFTQWLGSFWSGLNPLELTMDRNYLVEAEFEPDELQYTVTILAGAGGSVEPAAGAHTYAPGTVVSIKAMADSTHTFVSWSGSAVDEGRVADPSAAQTTLTVDGDYTLTASFEPLGGTTAVVYANDFSGPVSSEWSHRATDVTPIGARRFLGRFGNDTVTLTLENLPPHVKLTLSFDLFVIQSWDGDQVTDPVSGATVGPDPWQVALDDGRVLLRTTFSNVDGPPYLYPQSYPGWYPGTSFPFGTGAAERNTLGYTFTYQVGGTRPADSVYHLSFDFSHSASSCAIAFSASGLQGINDESWGLDNIRVEVQQDSTVYSSDFGSNVGPEWSHPYTDITPVGGRRFLGQFCNDTVTLTLQDLPEHEGVWLSFDLLVIRSWDGDTSVKEGQDVGCGPDVWRLTAYPALSLLYTTFSNHHMPEYAGSYQSYPHSYGEGIASPQEGASEANTLGYTFDFAASGTTVADAVYRLQFRFEHSAPVLRLDFSAWGLQGIYDESWGLDNVEVQLLEDGLEPIGPLIAHDPVPANGSAGSSPSVLHWKAGRTAAYHDVYFGLGADLDEDSFVDRLDATECVVPYSLALGTTYYWRVDEVEADGTTIHTGEVWSFTAGQTVTEALTISSEGTGSVLTPGEGLFEIVHGTVQPIEAVPAESSVEFRAWMGTAVDQGKVQDPSAAQTTVLVDDDYTLKAIFAPRPEGPILGFSLGEITGDDPEVFAYRVTTNNTTDATFVERVTGLAPDPNGMTRLRVVADEPARAKARFGKYAGQRVLVRFSYLFTDPGDDLELVVYLSDVPELLAHDDPLRGVHYVEIGRVPAPPAGRPGAFGSERFGVFQEAVSTGGLDLNNGTWVELELVQSGQRVYAAAISQGGIRWASDGEADSVVVDGPAVEAQCDGYCMDLNGSFSVDEEDFLVVMAYCGAPAGLVDDAIGSLYCLDGAFSSDGYIDPFDLSSWDWSLSDLNRTNLCFEPVPLVAGGTAGLGALSVNSMSAARSVSLAATDALSDLLILGKGQSFAVLTDGLYTFSSDVAFLGNYAAAGLRGRCNLRLLRDPAENLYVANSEYGVVRLTSPVRTVIPLGQADYTTEPRYHSLSTVSIGLQGQGPESVGRPVLDVAFDTQGYAYVVPVVVEPRGESPYVAAAKLRVQQSASLPYQVVWLYDDPPASNDNRDPNHQREIEVDTAGNVYVLNADRFNEGDILWKYGWNGSLLRQQDLTGPNSPVQIADPLALHVCADGQTLYLASGQSNAADVNAATLYAFSTADLQYQGTVTIEGMHHVTGITEDPATGTLWVAGFVVEKTFLYPGAPPTASSVPCLAPVPSGIDRVQAVPLSSPGLHDLALPTSIVWTGANGTVDDSP